MNGVDLQEFGGLITAVLIGVAALVGAVSRPLFDTLRRVRSHPVTCKVTETALEHIHELHRWHGPDHRGEQGWRGHGLERGLTKLAAGQVEMNKLLRELVNLAKERKL